MNAANSFALRQARWYSCSPKEMCAACRPVPSRTNPREWKDFCPECGVAWAQKGLDVGVSWETWLKSHRATLPPPPPPVKAVPLYDNGWET